MRKPFYELKTESQKILEAAYENHYGVLQFCEIGKKWVIKIRERKIVKIDSADDEARLSWNAAIDELRDNEYVKPHLDTYKVTEQGYLCAENKS